MSDVKIEAITTPMPDPDLRGVQNHRVVGYKLSLQPEKLEWGHEYDGFEIELRRDGSARITLQDDYKAVEKDLSRYEVEALRRVLTTIFG